MRPGARSQEGEAVGPQGGVTVPRGVLLPWCHRAEVVSSAVWQQTQFFYCFVLKLSGFSWLRLWKKGRLMCSEEKLALTAGKCAGGFGELNSKVDVRGLGTGAVKFIFLLLWWKLKLGMGKKIVPPLLSLGPNELQEAPWAPRSPRASQHHGYGQLSLCFYEHGPSLFAMITEFPDHS